MKISIVTLSFNQKPYLQEAVESVLGQGYPELEYIVVDPGSTDGSRELIESYRGRLAHVILEPDRGAADGLNKGFAQASGEIYGFLNADDLLLPGSLERVASFFKRNPDVDLAMGDGYTIDGMGRRIRHYRASSFSTRRFFYGGSQWLQQSTFFRESLFQRSPKFNLENRTCWDGELFVNFARMGAQIGYIRADLAGFRIHDSSISGSGRMNEEYKRDSRRIFREVCRREWNTTDELRRLLYRAERFLRSPGMWLQTWNKKKEL